MEATEHGTYHEDYIDLQQYWLVLKRRWLPAAFAVVSTVGLAALYSYYQEPIYEAKARLLFKNQGQELALPELEAKAVGFGQQSNPLANEAEIIRSIPIVKQVIEELDLRDEEGELLTPKAFLRDLEVTQVTDTDILELAYRSPDPEQAAQVVDKLMELYRENNILTNRSEAAAAREFIEAQLPKTEQSVRKAEEALRRFKEENAIIALAEEAELTVGILGELDQQYITAQSELEEARTHLEQLTNRIGLEPQNALVAGELSQSPAIQEVRSQYQEVEAELAVKQTLFQSEHPEIIALKEKRSALSELLQQRMRSVLSNQNEATFLEGIQLGELKLSLTEDLIRAEVRYLGLASRVSALDREQQTYQARAKILPKLEQGQRELERQLNAAQSTYEALLQRLQEVRVAENQNLGNARIVENALVPENPISPRIALNLALGGVLGLLLGGATAVILDARDRTLKTVQEAKECLGLTMLGSIPLFSRAGKGEPRTQEPDRPTVTLPVRDLPRSPISETFRMLQANLKFSCSDRPLKKIVVTSSIPREGKSTVSANLGLALSELGNRVLIIDADMRRPSQHQVWEQPNTVGLSNVLVEQIDLKAAAKQESPNLDVLTAGVIPPNPVALLDSQRMLSLLEQCSQDYDYIIIDTPPLAVAADAVILGKVADGVLLVVRPGVVDSSSVMSSKEALKRSQQPVLGMIVNGVNPSNEPDSYYYYYAKGYYAEPESKPKRGFLSRKS